MKRKLLLNLVFCLCCGVVNAQYFQWSKKESDFHKVNSSNVAVGEKFVVSSGLILNSVNFGGQALTSNGLQGNTQGYLAKYDLAGNLLWSKKITSTGIFYTEVKIDIQNNIYLTGTYRDFLTIDQPIFVNPQANTNTVFIAKFSAAGNLLWAKKATGSLFTNTFLKLATDNLGNVYLAGDFHNPITFGTTTLTSAGMQDIFLTKYNFKGELLWTNRIGNANTDEAAHITVSPLNNIFITYLNNYNQVKIEKYNSAGSLVWQNSVNNTNGILSVDNAENVYIAGSYSANLTFGAIPLAYSGSGTSYNSNYFLSKLNSNGHWVWAKSFLSGNYDKTSFNRFYSLALDPLVRDHINLACTIMDTASISNQTFSNATIIAKFDTAGNAIHATGLPHSISNIQEIEKIATDKLGNNYLIGEFNGSLSIGATTLTHNGLYTSTFLTKLLQQANTISGSMFIDYNNNGIRENGEPPYPNGLISVTPGNRLISTDYNGNYNFYEDTGSYVLSPLLPAQHYIINPLIHSVSLTGLSQHQYREFALQPIPNRDDIKITVTNITPARPGFSIKYRITFENVGTTILADSISFNYNHQYLTYNSATQNPVLNIPGKLAWFYQPLSPFEKRNIDVEFTVAATTPLNTQLMAHAAAMPLNDELNWNNQDTLQHLVTGSFDPNDKLVNYARLTPAQVADSTLLNYVIRFQNTGTDTAFTVIVRDSISDKMHMPTFELLSASHPYSFRFLENGMAEWRFDNILLPDSNRNEPASHGFIRYRMQPKTNLVLGDEIKARAAIYFDYNAPVLTNYAVTTIANPLGIKGPKPDLLAFKLYPNPAKNYVMVAAEFKRNLAAKVTLINMLGQVISEVTLLANNQIHYQLPLNNLPKGVYVVQLETEAGRQTQRLVIQ